MYDVPYTFESEAMYDLGPNSLGGDAAEDFQSMTHCRKAEGKAVQRPLQSGCSHEHRTPGAVTTGFSHFWLQYEF